jgi:hypothetical protein
MEVMLSYNYFVCLTVALARIMFPMEARVAMDIAQVDGTLEFNHGSSANLPSEMQLTAVDLNDSPFIMKEEYLARMRALSKTGDTNCLYLTTKFLYDLYSQTTSSCI